MADIQPSINNINEHRVTSVSGALFCNECGIRFENLNTLNTHFEKNHKHLIQKWSPQFEYNQQVAPPQQPGPPPLISASRIPSHNSLQAFQPYMIKAEAIDNYNIKTESNSYNIKPDNFSNQFADSQNDLIKNGLFIKREQIPLSNDQNYIKQEVNFNSKSESNFLKSGQNINNDNNSLMKQESEDKQPIPSPHNNNNRGFVNGFPNGFVRPKNGREPEKILDLDSQRVHVYQPPPTQLPVRPPNPGYPRFPVPPSPNQGQSLDESYDLVSTTTMTSPDLDSSDVDPNFSKTSGSQGKGNWRSNEARRPKTYHCTACNKWFTSSGHLKRHYNTTLHKNAVKQSGQPDPCTLPVSVHHHPYKDPNFSGQSNNRGGGKSVKARNSISPRQNGTPSPPDAMSPHQVPQIPQHSTMAPPSHSLPLSYSPRESAPFSPSAPTFSPREPTFSPREHTFSPRETTFNPREPTFSPREPTFSPRGEHTFSSREAQFSPKIEPESSYPSPSNLIKDSSQIINNNYSQDPPNLMAGPSDISEGLLQPQSHLPTSHYQQFMPLPTSLHPPPTSIQPQNFLPLTTNYPNFQAPHVSSTQQVTNINLIGNQNVLGQQVDEKAFIPLLIQATRNQFISFHQGNVPQFVSMNMSEEYDGGLSNSQDLDFSTETNPETSNNSVSNNDSQNVSSTSYVDYSILSEQSPESKHSPDSAISPNNYSTNNNNNDNNKNNNNHIDSIYKVKVEEGCQEVPMLHPLKPLSYYDDPLYEQSCDIISSTNANSEKDPLSPTCEDEKAADNLRCNDCNKFFFKLCYLKQHNRCFHSGEKPFKCIRCGKRYVDQTVLDLHMTKHGGEKPHKCSLCEKSFHHKTDLRRHYYSHSVNKPHTCFVCKKGFIRKDHMLKHTSIHKKKSLDVDTLHVQIPSPDPLRLSIVL